MLLIFWEAKENPVTKEAIGKALSRIPDKLTGCKLSASPAITDYKKRIIRVILVDSARIKHLNKTYRRIDKETDVLSFAELDFIKGVPAGTQSAVFLREEKILGEIYINYDWVKNMKHKIQDKLIQKLFIHGYLHLLGYDHEKDYGEMSQLEKKLNKSCLQ